MENFSGWLKSLNTFETSAIWSLLGVALLSIGYALFLRSRALRYERGPEEVQAAGDILQSGIQAYLGRQSLTTWIILGVGLAAMVSSVLFIPPTYEAAYLFGTAAPIWVGVGRAAAFVVGAFLAFFVGGHSAKLATASASRAAAAARKGYNPALQLAYRSGTASALLIGGAGLAVSMLILVVGGIAAPDLLIGFGAGGSVAAFAARVGGSLYGQGISLGATLAEQGEPPIPRDDPRSPAAPANMVGRQTSGGSAPVLDSFESLEMLTVAALILGVLLGDAARGGMLDGAYDMRFAFFPLLLRGISLVAFAAGSFFVRTSEERRNALATIKRGVYITAALGIAGAALVAWFYMHDWRPFMAALVGVALAVVLDAITGYFTSTHFKPVKDVSRLAQTGTTSTILSGTALGLESSVWMLATVAGAILSAGFIYAGEPLPTRLLAIFYGVSLVGIGAATLAGNIIAMGVSGTVSASANSLAEGAKLEKNARNVTEDLAAVGTTTSATSRGAATGIAIIASVSLAGALLAYLNDIKSPLFTELTMPTALVGMVIGSVVPLLVSATAIRSLVRVVAPTLKEIRQQATAITPAPQEGSDTPPGLTRVIHILADATRTELLYLVLIVILSPLLVGLLVGLAALRGFVVGLILVGALLALFQSNAGSAWDNARKYIEEGFSGGKNSAAHRAAIEGGAAGGVLKEIVGAVLPSVIKLSSLAALVIAPVVVAARIPDRPLPLVVLLALLFCFGVLVWAIFQGQREGEGVTRRRGATPIEETRTLIIVLVVSLLLFSGGAWFARGALTTQATQPIEILLGEGTATPTLPATAIPTATFTPVPTPTATATLASTPTPTSTPAPSPTATMTAIPTPAVTEPITPAEEVPPVEEQPPAEEPPAEEVPPVEQPPAEQPAEPTVYVVQPGDTMGNIAAQFNIPLQELLDYNNMTLEEAGRINIGQEILIPPQ